MVPLVTRKRVWKSLEAIVVGLLLAACTNHSTGPGGLGSAGGGVGANVALVDAAKVACPAAVTATCVTVGNVSTLGGLLPGLFLGAEVGTDAYLSYIDSTRDGVGGRMIRLASADDALTGDANRAATQSLVSRVLAFVGSFSLFDQNGGQVLEAHPSVANVSVSLSRFTNALPNTFSIDPLADGWDLGQLEYFKQHFPQAVKHVGMLVVQEASAQQQASGLEAAMRHEGYQIVYNGSFGIFQSDFTADVLRMRSAGVQMVDMTALDSTIATHIVQAMNQQGFHPALIEGQSVIYTDDFVQQAGGSSVAAGICLTPNEALCLGGDAPHIPAIRTFLTWVQRVHPGFKPDLFTFYGWASAQLFVQALGQAGSSPTPAGVEAQLRTIHHFDADGMMAPGDPADRKPLTCWILARINGAGKFVRVSPTPPTGFMCNAGYYYARS